jgi:hypothetical protein
MRRIPVVLGAVAVAVGTAGAITATGGAQEGGGETIELISKGGSFRFIDERPAARSEEDASAGDQFILSVPLSTAGGKRVGVLDAQCTFTKPGKNIRGLCEGAYSLPKGQIFIAARLSNNDARGAVVGGTGAYVGARGTVSSIDRPGEKNGDPSDETIKLLP